jgi:anti-sigma factor RsiW
MTRLTCREFIEFLWQYESGELAPEERSRFDDHLSRCDPCVRYLQSYRETVKIGKAALAPTEEPVPTTIPEELIQAILSSREKST